MTLIQWQRRQQSQKLKKDIQCLIHDEMRRMSPWWFVSFHYRDHHGEEDRILQDVADLKRKLCRFIYKSRDKAVKGAGAYPYPKMIFIHERSHQGTGQFHTHLIAEKFPASLNSQEGMEVLFSRRLPGRVKALSRWKTVDVQRINQHGRDFKCMSSYLAKQANIEMIALDPFNSDLSRGKK